MPKDLACCKTKSNQYKTKQINKKGRKKKRKSKKKNKYNKRDKFWW
jgi:hypothetical protein